MEAQDAGELLDAHERDDQKNRIALIISILAFLLAVTSLGGSNASKEATQENILAANAYAFYQAKNIRQTSLKLAATNLEIQLLRDPAMPAPARGAIEKNLEDYRKNITRYESEPDTQEGKKELLARAKAHEAARDTALRQDPWFDYAQGMLQIAIVLLSASIIAGIRALFLGGSALGVLGALAMLNGFFLFV